MNATDPHAAPAASHHSPFWALLAVFGVLLFLQAMYVLDDFKQRSQILSARAQLKTALTQAGALNQTTEAVGRDLLALSTNSVEAAKIIAEFKIKLNTPPKAQP
jgi:hypothetical protein